MFNNSFCADGGNEFNEVAISYIFSATVFIESCEDNACLAIFSNFGQDIFPGNFGFLRLLIFYGF